MPILIDLSKKTYLISLKYLLRMIYSNWILSGNIKNEQNY